MVLSHNKLSDSNQSPPKTLKPQEELKTISAPKGSTEVEHPTPRLGTSRLASGTPRGISSVNLLNRLLGVHIQRVLNGRSR